MPMLITTTLTLAETLRRTREKPRSGRSAQSDRRVRGAIDQHLHHTAGAGAVPRDAVTGELHERVAYAAHHSAEQTLARMGSRPSGLTANEAIAARDLYGANVIPCPAGPGTLQRLLRAFANPFTGLLALTALVLLFTNPLDSALIAIMVIVSGILRAVQETRGDRAIKRLRQMVPATCLVTRGGQTRRIPVDELVPADILHVARGEIVPADARVISTKNLLIDQSLLTGESAPVEKVAASPDLEAPALVTDYDAYDGVVFAGTAVHAGSGTAVVLTTGPDTYLGQMTRVLDARAERTANDAGMSSTARILLLFIAVMVPIVFAVNLFARHDAMESLLFAAAVMVGITPQLLPAITTSCLARGAMALSKRQVIVKNLAAVQNLSAMDILCCDKTGTLTTNDGTGDVPRDGVLAATAALGTHGVDIKVLTGDNRRAAARACHEVGISARGPMLGPEVDLLTDEQLAARAERTRVFAEISPLQKARIVRVLREHGGHTVGFVGDGANDAPAMRTSDCGIALEGAVDVAREAADLVLLRSDLAAIDRAALEGRRAYGNLIKYIKVTASSNLGNVLSVLAAGAVLPFLPMTALQLIVLSLAYTAVCAALPWDRVDRSFLERPRAWQPRAIVRFMMRMAPASTLFDLLTFAFLFLVLCPAMAGGGWSELVAAGDGAGIARFVAVFQTGWFVVSMWTQSLVLHALRTQRRAVTGSRPGIPLAILTVAGLAICTALPFTPYGADLGLCPLPPAFFGWLVLLTCGYLSLAGFLKARYIQRYRELL